MRIVFLIIICFWGCSPSESSLFSSIKTLDSSGVKYIPVDSTVRTTELDIQMFVNNRDSLLAYLSNRTLYFHDFKSGELRKKITIASEGPRSIGGKISYFIHSIDSIFVANSYEIGIINRKGELYYKYDFRNANGNYSFSLPPDIKLNSYNPIIKNVDEVIIPGYPYITPFDLNNFQNEIGALSLKLKKKEVKEFLKYPQEYRTNYYTYNHLTYSSCLLKKEGKVVYSFQASPYIFIYDLNQNLQDSVLFKSNYIGNIDGTDYPVTDSEILFQTYVQSPSYFYVYYDNKINQIYRIAQFGRSKEDFDKRKWWKENILMSMNLKTGEVKERLLSEQLDVSNLIIAEEGIYIRHANLNNKYPINSDDYIILEKYDKM